LSFTGLERRDIQTPLGVLTLWGLPEPADADRPALIAITGSFMPLDTLAGLPGDLGESGQVLIGELPLRGTEPVLMPSLVRLAEALGLAVHEALNRRPVVLVGFGDAALVAALARAPEIVRVIAVEPPVMTSKLWPLRDALKDRLRQEADPGLRTYLSEAYRAAPEGETPRDHRPLFAGNPAPVVVLVGDQPLSPERRLDHPPSHVDEEDRAWLAKTAGVEVIVAPEAGHEIAREAGDLILSLSRRALARAATARRPDSADLAKTLAFAAPRTVRRVRYVGDAAPAFQAACLALNPQAGFAGDAYDLLVLQDPELGDLDLESLLQGLEPDGLVLATTPLGRAGRGLARRLDADGLSAIPLDPRLTPQASALLRARKGPARLATPLEIVPYAPFLMDIRTRFPAAAMRSDPDLRIHYHPPPLMQPIRAGRPPSVAVLQRPRSSSPEDCYDFAARAILARQVAVLEWDDHPALIAEMVSNRRLEDSDWEVFRSVHAIQTSTAPLAEVFGAYNPEVRMFPNAVFDLAPFMAGERPRRVFYGGVTRGAFAAEVAAALRPAIEAYPDTEFWVLGDQGFFDALPTANKIFSGYHAYESYLRNMAECSISLSPLQARPLIETKSDAKYLEAARAGVLTIASPPVYERTIRSGENGFIATTLEDWPRILALVLGDPDLRERVARAAWEDVRAHRMFGPQIAERRAWYADLLARREEINAALLARSPGVAARLAQLTT
jgi:hypothetical protein